MKQTDSMLCGAACMASVCRFYGRHYSLGQLSIFCKNTTDGISLLGLSKAATSLGFDSMCLRLTPTRLTECTLPCILHWNQNHFVVLYKIDINRKVYYVCDPAKGRIKYAEKDFFDHWLSSQVDDICFGIVLMLEPNENFGCVPESKETKRKAIRMLTSYAHQYRKYLVIIALSLLIASILQLIMPFLTQSIVDYGIRQKNISFIWLVVLGEFFIICGRTATIFVRQWLLLHISMRVNISLLSDFFIKLLKLPMAFFETKQMGDLMQRMRDHERIESFLTSQMLNILFDVLSFIVFGIVLFIYNPSIFGLFIAGSILYGVWIAAFMAKRRIIDYERFELESINHDRTFQFLTSIQEIKLQSCEQRRRWEWEDIQADLFAIHMKSLQLRQSQDAGSVFINEFKNILITVFAATAVINGNLTLGSMLAIQYIIGQLNSPVEQFLSFAYSMQDVGISLERINEIHQRNNEERNHNISSFQNNSSKSIVISNIEFKYDPFSSVNIIDKVSIEIPQGEITAIVGASGSGKTTLIKLLLGYYPVLSGEIDIAGQNINQYNLKWWREQCGVVMQDGIIFSESIARNIAVDDNEIDMTRVIQAAKIACVDEYVSKLPLKYDTIIGREGAGLSQGQKQRILIARAVYKRPDFIFFDEATNSLDATNESRIVQNLNKFYVGRTVVIVAHRLSTVRHADNIIVLNKGKVAECGKHEELIEKHGIYYNLIKNQLELGN